MSSPQSIGIDLGTTFCCVAALRNGNPKSDREPFPEVIQNNVGKNTTPSYVNYEEEGNISVGQTAKDQSNENPENTVFDVKRLMGRSFYDLHVSEYNRNKLWPFHLVNYKGLVGVNVQEKTLLPQEIAAELIKHLLEAAQAWLGCQIDSAVVTVPTHYSSLQKELTREACAIAGLYSVQLITEPHAAAFAYGLHFSRHFDGPKTCFIFDLGGGTFDVTVFTLGAGNQVEIKGVGGDPKLGGEDFNDLLTEYCINEFKQMTNVDLTEGKLSENPAIRLRTARRLRKVRNECERQKCYLSSARKVNVSLDGLHQDHDMHVLVTRATFENLIAGYLARCMGIITNVLKSSNVGVDEIDDVVLIGGSSRIPKVKELVEKYFGGKRLHTIINPDEAVACGAAIYAKNHFQSLENSFIENNITVVDKFNDENAALKSQIQRGDEEILRLVNELRKAEKAEPKLENLKATEIDMTKMVEAKLVNCQDEITRLQLKLESALFKLNQKQGELEKEQQQRQQDLHAEELSVQILKLENIVADKEGICKMLLEEIVGKENLNLNLRNGLNKAEADLKGENEAKIGLMKENEALKSKIIYLERSVDAVTNELDVKMKQLLKDIQN